MDINTMKEEQKKLNAQNAIILKSMNLKKNKFNWFHFTVGHKRNKAEQKLYLLLNDDQKQDIKLICDVLGLNMDFFNYWNGRNHKIYMTRNNPIHWAILKAPADGIEPAEFIIKTISEIETILTPLDDHVEATQPEGIATNEEAKPTEATATDEGATQDVEIIHKKTIDETAEALAHMDPAEKVEFAKNALKKLSLEAPKVKKSKAIKKLGEAKAEKEWQKLDDILTKAEEKYKANPTEEKPIYPKEYEKALNNIWKKRVGYPKKI